MSFSSEVKEELEKILPSGRHCVLAELMSIVTYGGKIESNTEGKQEVVLHSENESVSRKCFTLLKKTDIVGTDILKMQAKEDQDVLLKKDCCRRSYLRGAFLAVGSMSDPKKSYHLEFDCEEEKQALRLQKILSDFEIESKIVLRKKYYVVYLKEGSAIVDLLGVIGAHLSLMNLESLRVEKEMRNSINRKVNCETANIAKTVTAANRQIEDIKLIGTQMGFANLPENLRKIAELRLQYPDSSLLELGSYLSPPVGKSGVNHRLRKLSEIADRIRA